MNIESLSKTSRNTHGHVEANRWRQSDSQPLCARSEQQELYMYMYMYMYMSHNSHDSVFLHV